MNCLSLNAQGLGSKAKKDWIKELNNKHKVNFLSIQETKMEFISAMDVKVLWGNYCFDYLFSESLGNSGGILCVWDSNFFHKEQHTISDNFIALYGTWVPSKTRLLFVSIYAPQSDSGKRSLWSFISIIISRWDGECIVMGDFNEVRFAGERMGSNFNVRGARDFNSFISSSGLVDVQLEGYSFTWSHPTVAKMSKLDRFLISEGFVSLFPHVSAICLDKHLSDHRPILLRDVISDYGATPFHFYHYWFKLNGFEQMVINTWNSISLEDRNGMIRLKKKLQLLKKEIRSWVVNYKKDQSRSVTEIKSKLQDIDKLIDQGGVNDDLLLSRNNLMKQLQVIKSTEDCDRVQKAKIQWAIKGDENSKFYHGIINRKRAKLSIKGIMVDGEWVDDPNRVKEEFRSHFFRNFNPREIRFWDVIGADFCVAVEWFFQHSSFVKGCNSSFITLIPKTLDLKFVSDYRPISLIGSLYNVVTKVLATRLSFVISGLVSDVQTAFLPNHQILDGPFIINELLSWCKFRKQHAMVFKVDFAKAYDSIWWDYLDDVLDSFGFGSKWRSWISSSLLSGMVSIFINGSPTSEFQLHRDLKQGDPLAPYLFILVMESFHISITRATEAGLSKGIKIDSSLMISHLFYADDAVFIGE
ncbi:RNA-directed DNA polymerase, eukaryota [Tanacetum coccineum]